MIKITRARVIHAGPTSGKSTLMQALKEAGVKVFDTDEYLRDADPQFWEDGKWVSPKPADKARAEELREVAEHRAVADLSSDPSALLVTNLWGPHAQGLAKIHGIGGKLPVSLFPSPEVIAERSRARDGSKGIPVSLAKKWHSKWEKGAKDAFVVTHALGANEFLSDVLDFSAHPAVADVHDRYKAALERLLKERKSPSLLEDAPTSENSSSEEGAVNSPA